MEQKLISWHGKPELKEKYIKIMQEHREADKLVKGVYWERGKGCAVGCMFHGRHHQKYESKLGIPEWLAYLEDRIFEGLPNGKSQEWPVRFLNAIPVGKDLSLVLPKFLLFVLQNLPKDYEKRDDCKKAIQEVMEILALEAQGKKVSDKRKESAESVARSARSAAWSAAWSAAYEKMADELIKLLEEAEEEK